MGRSDSFVLPTWMPADAWKAYEEMRKQIKRPMTPYAKNLAIRKLFKLQQEGNDITAVLEQSVFNCWQGLFAIEEVQPRPDFMEENQRAIRRVFGKSPN